MPYVNGLPYDRPEAAKQTKPKLARLHKLINHIDSDSAAYEEVDIARLIPIYVFSHPEARLDPNLAYNYVTLAALPSMFRTCRDLFDKDKEIDNLKYIKDMVKSALDKSPNPKESHMLKLAEMKGAGENLINFKNLHIAIASNNQKLQEIDNSLNAKLKNAALGISITVLSSAFAVIYLQSQL